MERMDTVDWRAVEEGVSARGFARAPGVLTPECCSWLKRLDGKDERFRSRIDMERHAFGVGRYGYFAEPLPDIVEALRSELYRRLQPLANRMMEQMHDDTRFPEDLGAFREVCRAAGQSKPTPLLLRYEAGGYNRLHQDRYGAIGFPLQATILLSDPDVDFAGGEFLLVENRARQQSRGEAIALAQGEMIVFASSVRPAKSARGHSRATMRHGVSTVERGTRYALGLILHDAA